MSKISIIELSRLGQDLFDFTDLTWAHPLTHPSSHRWGVSTNHKSSNRIELSQLGQDLLSF